MAIFARIRRNRSNVDDAAASMPVVTEHPAVTLAAVCAVAVALGITAARRRVGALPR